jgi:hypothetical protein
MKGRRERKSTTYRTLFVVTSVIFGGLGVEEGKKADRDYGFASQIRNFLWKPLSKLKEGRRHWRRLAALG